MKPADLLARGRLHVLPRPADILRLLRRRHVTAAEVEIPSSVLVALLDGFPSAAECPASRGDRIQPRRRALTDSSCLRRSLRDGGHNW